MVTALKICDSVQAMKISNLTFSYAMFTFLFLEKKLIFPKYRNRPKTIPCLVSHLLLSQVRVKKGTILFCLLAENQGVPGHEFPPCAENCVNCEGKIKRYPTQLGWIPLVIPINREYDNNVIALI